VLRGWSGSSSQSVQCPHAACSAALQAMALFIWLIIRLIQLGFLVGTIFFSHKKSANSVFQPAYNSSWTAPMHASAGAYVQYADDGFWMVEGTTQFSHSRYCDRNSFASFAGEQHRKKLSLELQRVSPPPPRRSGLVHFPILTQNISSSTYHIKSFDACMEH
jgi:hypothetical protein